MNLALLRFSLCTDSFRKPQIIIMSATIDPTPFVNFLGPDKTRVIYIEGRPHPIRILNVSNPGTDYVADAATACLQVLSSVFAFFNGFVYMSRLSSCFKWELVLLE